MAKTKPGQKLQEIRYFRVIKPPTLKQYLFRRAVSLVMKGVVGQTGTDIDPVTKRPVPCSAIRARDLLQGVKAEDLAAEHPEWIKDYEKEYGNGTGDKKAR